MPDRIIRGKARKSATLAQLTAEEERLFWRLITVADDAGRFEAAPDVVRGLCFPGSMRIDTEAVEQWIIRLDAVGLIQRYIYQGSPLGQFVTWSTYQDGDAERSEFPGPDRADKQNRVRKAIATKVVTANDPTRLACDRVGGRAPATGRDTSISTCHYGSTGIDTGTGKEVVTGTDTGQSNGITPGYPRVFFESETDLKREHGVGGLGGGGVFEGRASTHESVNHNGENKQLAITWDEDQTQLDQRRSLLALSGAAQNVPTSGSLERIQPPAELAAFDAILCGIPTYRPTRTFYDRVITRYLNVDGLDVLWIAECIVGWMRANPGKRKHVVGVADTWLARELENATRQRQRQSGNNSGNRSAKGSTNRFGMAGGTPSESKKSANDWLKRAGER